MTLRLTNDLVYFYLFIYFVGRGGGRNLSEWNLVFFSGPINIFLYLIPFCWISRYNAKASSKINWTLLLITQLFLFQINPIKNYSIFQYWYITSVRKVGIFRFLFVSFNISMIEMWTLKIFLCFHDLYNNLVNNRTDEFYPPMLINISLYLIIILSKNTSEQNNGIEKNIFLKWNVCRLKYFLVTLWPNSL